MKIGFYPKLALDGIRKNKRMYFPYILTCTGMVMMTYIVNYLKTSSNIYAVGDGATVREFMNIGVIVLTFFSALFLFYTNSFLIRRRKKEFGLYNILGMGKKNIGILLFWESFFVAVFSIVTGLAGGIAFSKLAEIGFINILHGEVSYSLSISVESVIFTAVSFAVIFLLLFLNALRQVWFSSAITLLRSENAGEKPPRANYFFGIVGFVLLGVAYYLAVTIDNPISALGVFVVAVIMVIAATYLIMIAGSVWFCRVLQKRKKYYYKSNHFISVSSMLYRMKRNGAGLASICILATMVLVMISSTSALFIGGEEIMNVNCPRGINTWFRATGHKEITDTDTAFWVEQIDGVLKKHGVQKDNILEYKTVRIAGMLNGGDVIFDTNDVYDFSIGTYSDVVEIYFVPLEDYNEIEGRDVTLAPDEVLVYPYRTDFSGDTFGFFGVNRYTVKEHLKTCFVTPEMSTDIVPSFLVVVPDIGVATNGLVDSDGNDMTYRKWTYCFDVSLDKNAERALLGELNETLRQLQIDSDEENHFISDIESRESYRAGFYSLYGGIFYLGIILSIVFVFAAVLIIYYKQVSEGYEDQSRFEIMQKVGMTKKEIRRSINSQLLTVFFLPLVGAGLHLAFAFPIIEKLLLLFSLHNRPLFICTTVASLLVFALFYVIVYRITSNAYYQIVSGAKEKETARP